MGTDVPRDLGFAEKSENLASLLAEFLFYPAPFAKRMHPCPFFIRVHPGNQWFSIISCKAMQYLVGLYAFVTRIGPINQLHQSQGIGGAAIGDRRIVLDAIEKMLHFGAPRGIQVVGD